MRPETGHVPNRSTPASLVLVEVREADKSFLIRHRGAVGRVRFGGYAGELRLIASQTPRCVFKAIVESFGRLAKYGSARFLTLSIPPGHERQCGS